MTVTDHRRSSHAPGRNDHGRNDHSPGTGAADSVSWLRAGAVICILYSFLPGVLAGEDAAIASVVGPIRTWVNQPLGIGEDFGLLGIGLLLVAEGRVARDRIRYSRTYLIGWWLRRTVVLLAVASGVAALVSVLGGQLLPPDVTVVTTPPLLAPLSWPLLAHSLHVVALAAVGARASPWVTLGVAAGVIVAAGATGAPWWGMLATFVPFLVMSQPIPGIAALAVISAAPSLLPELASWWYPLMAVYVLLLSTLVYRHAGSPPTPVRWLARKPLAVLVLVGSVGTATAHLVPAAGWLLGVVATLTIATAVGRPS